LPEVDFRIIQALSALGRNDDARREAAKFVARHPSNVNSEQLKRLMGGTNDEP
jgi:hypothetical protein